MTTGGGTGDGRPPRLGRWLVELVLPPSRREEVLGDLAEAFRSVRSRRGATAAGLWYLREGAAFAGAVLTERVALALSRFGPGALARAGGGWLRDARAALRGLARAPGFTALAVATLAVGIGGTTAIFSVVDGVLLRPLPFASPDRLVAIRDTFPGDSWWSASPANVTAWRDRSRTLEGVAWAQAGTRVFSATGEPEQLRVQRVSAGVLGVLGVEPLLGRDLQPGDVTPDAAPVALLSHRFWTRLGADPSVVGSSVTLDGAPHTVIGVLPAAGIDDALGAHELLVPRVFTEAELESGGRVLRTVGRLAPGVGAAAAEEELAAITRQVEATDGWGVRLVPLRDQIVSDVRPALLLLLGSVVFVLLVACANVGNLLLARGSTRAPEMGVRAALGAGRGRLVRQLLAEAGLLALFGAVVGLAVARWGTAALAAASAGALPRAADVAVDGRVLLFTLAVTTASGLLFGVVPALRSAAVSPGSVLQGGRGAVSGGGARLRRGLVAVEVALVLLLLVGAGLMLRSLQELRAVDPGFALEDRMVVELTLPGSAATDRRVGDFFGRLADELRGVPGVAAVGVVSHPPLLGDDWSSFHIVESRPRPRVGEEPIGGMEIAGPGYFDALGLPVLEGRGLQPEDARPDGPGVVVVDEAMRALHWPDRSPVGDRVMLSRDGPRAEWYEVVGVVGATRYDLSSSPRPRLYVPENLLSIGARTRYLVVRSEPGRVDAVMPLVRGRIRAEAPDLPIASLRTLERAAAGSLSRVRTQTFLLATFAAVALFLGTVGVYGVVSYAVSRQTGEVGLRMALGAGRARVLARVLGRALTPVTVGLALGLAGSVALAALLRQHLFGVGPTDLRVLALTSALLLAVAAAAALVPGLRAAQVDPVRALRSD